MAHPPPAGPTPAQITHEIFTLFDTNADRSITLTELEGTITAHDHGHTPNFAPIEKLFGQLDTDHSGGLSPTEVNAAVTHLLTVVHDHAPEVSPPHNVEELLALLARATHHDWVV